MKTKLTFLGLFVAASFATQAKEGKIHLHKDKVRQPQAIPAFAVSGTYESDKAETKITVSGKSDDGEGLKSHIQGTGGPVAATINCTSDETCVITVNAQ